MAKRLNYQIGFTGDTSQLKKEINSVVAELNKIASSKANLSFDDELREASQAAAELSEHLKGAFNQDTGKLNLTALRTSLEKGGISLDQYRDKLAAIGPEGKQAFLNVATAIVRAETPLRKSNKLLDELWVTMKNTARWQLTSTALHSFMGGLQSAYGYAQDLNKSLNNIRIVTGKNGEEMADFAEQANKAAKALSSTTTEYTDASLIYFQQGLVGDAVTERANATIKMANVTGQSAQEVSDQLTSIWNNFYNGSQSLEYYADVITALGAATASSTEEISTGLEKFAAIASSVGLSYEYATSALATVTATTRQSADTVGTAFKTLFARIQGLQLGETLDDGTTLNKYSEALMKVGITIKDQNGDLKEMDDILNDMGDKWDYLNKDQQLALAQTVAGVRQYTQLVALMDNWDFFQENLGTASGSEGALEMQAKIYAESWEAARERVKASAEGVYDSLINPDFFISLDKGLGGLLTIIEDVIDSVGGLSGVVNIAAYGFMTLYSDKIAQSLRDMAQNTSILSGKQEQLNQQYRQSAIDSVKALRDDSVSNNAILDNMTQRLELEGQITQKRKYLSAETQSLIQSDLSVYNALQDQSVLLAKQGEQLSNNLNLIQQQYKDKSKTGGTTLDEKESLIQTQDSLTMINDEYNKISTSAMSEKEAILQLAEAYEVASDGQISRAEAILLARRKIGKEQKEHIDNTIKESKQYGAIATAIKQVESAQKSFTSETSSTKGNVELLNKRIEAIKFGLKEINGIELEDLLGETIFDAEHLDEVLTKLNEETQSLADNFEATLSVVSSSPGGEQLAQQLNSIHQQAIASGQSMQEFAATNQSAAEVLDQVNIHLNQQQMSQKDWAANLVEAGQSLSAVTMGVQAFANGLDRIVDPDTSGFEKFIAILTMASTILPVVTASQKLLSNVQDVGGVKAGFAAAKQALFATSTAATGAAAGGAIAPTTGFAAALNLAIWPLTLIVTIGAAVVGTIMAITNAFNKAQAAQREKAIAAYESTKEELDAQQELIDVYQEALATYEETGEGKDKLNEASLAMAEALDIEGAAVANLTGDYEALNKAMSQKQAELNEKQVSNSMQGMLAKGGDFKAAMKEGKGYEYGSSYSVGLGVISDSDQTAQTQALKESDFYKNYYKNGEFTTSNKPEDMIKMYEAAQEALEDMRNAQRESGEAASDMYNETLEWLAKSQSVYETYAASIDEVSQASFNTAIDAAGDTSNITSYQEYLDYYKTLNEEIDKRVKNGEIEADQVDKLREKYLLGEESLHRYVTQQELLNQMSKNFGRNFDFSSNEEIMKNLEGLSDEEMTLALSIATDSNSVEEFKNNLNSAITEMAGNAAQASIEVMSSVVQELNENMHVSDENYEAIQGDSAFMEQMEKDYGTFENFQALAERTQIEYIRDYYTQISTFAIQNLSEQEANAKEEFNIEQNKLNALRELEENHSDLLKEMARIRANYANASSEEQKQKALDDWEALQTQIEEETGIQVRFDIGDANESIDGLTNRLDEISDKIKDINKQKIEIAMDWDDFDDIRGQFDSLSKFASTMQTDAKKVGSSYQYPIEAVREWMDVYPDLFAQASVANNGLIQLDREVVDSYITGKKEETNANAEEKIKQWELEKQDLLVAKEAILAEMEAIKASEQGKIDITKMSNEQIASLGQQLTQYLIDNGNTEEEAHRQMLETMGLNEQEYSNIVAEVSTKNAQNMTESSGEGASNTITNLGKISSAIKNLGHNIQEAWKKFKDPDYKPSYKSIFGDVVTTTGYAGAAASGEFNSSESEEVKAVEEFKTKALDQLTLDLSAIDEAIANIDAKILAAKALELAPPEEGPNGPKDNKGGKDDKAKIEQLKEIAERYHEITREIEYQERVLKKLDTQIDRTYGSDKLKLYKKQQEELTKLAQLQSQKATMAAGFVGVDLEKIKSLGLNPIIDKESLDIDNYTEILQQIQNSYNAYMESYNKMTKAEQEAHETEKEAVQKEYDERMKALQKYEESIDTYRDNIDEMEDTLRQLEDSKLNDITAKLEIKLDMKEAEDELRDFAKKIAESYSDALYHGIKSMKLDNESAQSNINIYGDYAEQYQDLINRLNEANEFTDTEAIQEELDNLRGKILESGEALIEYVEGLEEELPDAIDDARERFELFTDTLEHNTSVLDSVKELITLQNALHGAEEQMGMLNKAYQEQYDASMAQAVLQKGYFERAKEQLKQAQTALENTTEGTAEYDILKANRDALLVEYRESQQAMLDAAKETMAAAQEMFSNQIDRALKAFENAMTNNKGFDYLQTKYDNFIDEEERYLDAVNTTYETTKYNNKIQSAIDKTSSLSAKNRLNDLKKELELRAENGKLSKYDLDIMNAKYEMTLKQIALEEAQNNKSQVRLKRDAQGNWSYQYTADQEKIDQANQDFMDAENEYYNIAKDQVKEITGEIIDTWQEMSDKIKEIYNDESLTVEERERQIAEIRNYYAQKIKDLEEEKNIAIKDMTEAGSKVIDDFDNDYGDAMANMTDNTQNFEEAFDKAIEEMEQAAEDYQNKINDVNDDVGTSYDDLGDIIGEVSDITDEAREAGEDAVDQMWDSLSAIQAQTQEYASLADSIMEVVRAYEKLAYQTMMKDLNDANGSSSDDSDEEDLSNDWINSTPAPPSSSGSGGGSSISHSDMVDLVWDMGVGKYANNPHRKQLVEDIYPGMYSVAQSILNDAINQDEKNYRHNGTRWRQTIERLVSEAGFASGGYTGNFSDARLAFLHEKELVLNQEDTRNILGAVSAVRTLEPALLRAIESMLDGNAIASQNLMRDKLAGGLSVDATASELVQHLDITAEFPNATDQNEIREAILGLANYATQFTNKR